MFTTCTSWMKALGLRGLLEWQFGVSLELTEEPYLIIDLDRTRRRLPFERMQMRSFS